MKDREGGREIVIELYIMDIRGVFIHLHVSMILMNR